MHAVFGGYQNRDRLDSTDKTVWMHNDFLRLPEYQRGHANVIEFKQCSMKLFISTTRKSEYDVVTGGFWYIMEVCGEKSQKVC